jgi:hypothetical protein
VENLAWLGMTSELRLLKDRLAIPRDFESSAARGNHLDLGVRVRLTNRGRQTDGPWLVVSYRAILDRDAHRHHPVEWSGRR